MMPNERGNIFQEESRRLLVFDNSGKLKEKSTSRVGKSPSEATARKGLTREPADEQVEIGHFCCINSCNVAIINLPLRVVNGFVSRRSVAIYFAIPDAFKASRLLETAAETADSRKAVNKFNCYKITPLQIFAPIFYIDIFGS